MEVATLKYISTLEAPFLPMTVHRRDGETLRALRSQLQLERLSSETSPQRAQELAAEAESQVERLRVRMMELHREFHAAAEFDAAPWASTGLAPGQLAAEYAELRPHDVHPHSEPIGWDEQEGLIEMLLAACRELGSADQEAACKTADSDLVRLAALLGIAERAGEECGEEPLSALPYYAAVANPTSAGRRDFAAEIRTAAGWSQGRVHIGELDAAACRSDLEAVEELQALSGCYKT